MSNRYLRPGAILKSRPTKEYPEPSFYWKTHGNYLVLDGKSLSLETPKQKLDRLLQYDKITEDQYDYQMEKIPDYIRFEAFTKNDSGIYELSEDDVKRILKNL